MSGGDLFLGLDVGTQGAKALLVDANAQRVVARASRSYGLIEGLGAGVCEQDPITWIEALREAARELFADRADLAARVAGVGVSGQQHGFVAVDRDLCVVRPAKLWCDTSTAREAAELSRRLSRHLPVGWTASKVLHMARHEPALWARTAHVLLPHDYVNARLTGVIATECGDASGTGWFDPIARRIDEESCAAIDARLVARLPPLCQAHAFLGTLNAEGAELLSLPRGVPVSVGGGDNMMSAIGSGATRPGVVVVSLGTSATVFTHSALPIVDRAGLIAPFADSTGAWLPLLCTMNATGVTEEVRRAFGGTIAECEHDAGEIEAGCGGLLWLPYLAGERVPDLPHASASLVGVRPGMLGRGRLYRAAIEGVAHNLAWGVDRMKALGITIEEVRVVGGASRSALWLRTLADVLAVRVQALDEPESAALGAALQAAWAVDRARGGVQGADEIAAPFVRTRGPAIEPDSECVAILAAANVRFRECARRLYDAT
jgi:xylulokinase